jgi:hypothetical protein
MRRDACRFITIDLYLQGGENILFGCKTIGLKKGYRRLAHFNGESEKQIKHAELRAIKHLRSNNQTDHYAPPYCAF